MKTESYKNIHATKVLMTLPIIFMCAFIMLLGKVQYVSSMAMHSAYIILLLTTVPLILTTIVTFKIKNK